MTDRNPISTSSVLTLGGILLLAMLIITSIGIFGAVLLYNSFPLKPFPIYLFGVLNLVPGFWLPVPNYGYTILREFISDLGVGPSSFLFNTSMIIAGLLLIAAFPTFLKPLGSTKIAKIGVAVGVIAGVSLIGVGVFTETSGIYHVIFATIFFLSIFSTIGILSHADNLSVFFSAHVVLLGYISSLLGIICTLLVPILGPTIEWTLLLFVLIWALPMAIDMLAKRKSV
ncbi:MAG: DUF998 domain-containing protein [Candidatus Jordarchaeaceae archaeon]